MIHIFFVGLLILGFVLVIPWLETIVPEDSDPNDDAKTKASDFTDGG